MLEALFGKKKEDGEMITPEVEVPEVAEEIPHLADQVAAGEKRVDPITGLVEDAEDLKHMDHQGDGMEKM